MALAFKTAVLCATLVLAPVTGSAACTQDHAVYVDSSDTLTLAFRPVGEAEVTSHVFEISVVGSKQAMQGHVIDSDEPVLPDGMVLFNCPQGDVTGADIEACTVWQNVVYASDARARFSYLPAGASEAAPQLLLADFGRSFRFSSAWDGMDAKTIPTGIFHLKGCIEAG
jgi:hypothetical protein